jgi:hypothetical protein
VPVLPSSLLEPAWIEFRALLNARRRRSGRRKPHQSPRCHPATRTRRRAGPPGPTATKTRAAPARPLALDPALATTLAGRHRHLTNRPHVPTTRTDSGKLGRPAATPHPKPSGGRAGGAPTTHRPGSVDSGSGSRSCPPRQAWAYKPPAAVRPKLRGDAAIELRHRPIPYTRLNRPFGNCSTLCSSIACRADDENNALPSPTISG